MSIKLATAPVQAKPFAWSFSKLKNFETCPKRHFHIEIAKDVKEEEGEALLWGNKVHQTLAAVLADPENIPLPIEMNDYAPWIRRVREGEDSGGTLLVEQKYAITKDLGPTAWFAKDAWYRAVGDVVRLASRSALILDWKTGKVIDDSDQLALMAQCIFAHYPQIERVRSEYIWLKDDTRTGVLYERADMPDLWVSLKDRIARMEEAARTQTYLPKPGYLCKNWCPVKACPYYKKGIQQ